MTDKHPEADSIMAELETEMAIANLGRRGKYVAAIAVMAGDILTVALAAGVPYALAKEMATDFWKSEVLMDTLSGLIREAEEDDEDDDE
ncbi:hypothetical protein GTY75_04935 [Streptomyces sp. SID8381]|uniref:hypothetical protein n=1 Tax=unclassified Streptomyces TaxID=2593676 RepID=UPI00036DEFFA|nr:MULTISPECIES: hypothetical protein [unclassified Streptomyces]MYX26019.1 hypothetical protein [Streptomyces sp. SID8381]